MEKPKEVSNEAIKLLEHIVEVLSNPEPRYFLKEIADAGLPDKVKAIITSEIDKKLDAEFHKKVEERAEQISQEKLNYKMKVEWHKWYKSYVEPRILELELKLINNAIAMLRGPWPITCDKCCAKFEIELTSEEIEEILKRGYIEVECQNPSCINVSLFKKHRIRIALRNFIESYIPQTE
ncbi:MAG: hypothetical protein QW589_03650 [Candidatus Bathyarchaeia archaeon]